MTLLSVSTLCYRRWCSSAIDTYGEERAVEKLFRCVPEKYKQMARSIESLLDLSTMSIEEEIGRLKVMTAMSHSLSRGHHHWREAPHSGAVASQPR